MCDKQVICILILHLSACSMDPLSLSLVYIFLCEFLTLSYAACRTSDSGKWCNHLRWSLKAVFGVIFKLFLTDVKPFLLNKLKFRSSASLITALDCPSICRAVRWTRWGLKQIKFTICFHSSWIHGLPGSSFWDVLSTASIFDVQICLLVVVPKFTVHAQPNSCSSCHT